MNEDYTEADYLDVNNNLDESYDSEESVASIENDSRKRNIVLGGTGLLIGLGIVVAYQFGWLGSSTSAAQGNSFAPPPAVVSVAMAEQSVLAPSSTLPGTVVSVRDATIASETSGKITMVALVGDIVEAGEALAEIDNKNATQLVSQREAELARLKSLYKYHKDYFARVNIEDDRLGIPEIGVAELRSNMETAKADVARAVSALEAARTDLERTVIRAPFSGRVVSQLIQPGEFAQVGNPVVRLVDTSSLEISAQVPAALVQPLATGTQLEVSGMGKSIVAPLRALVPVGDEISRTMELRVSLPKADFLVGSPVRVTLPTAAPKKVLAIPRDAVILRPNSQFVFVVDEDKKAHKKTVELGYSQDDKIEVIGDLSVGATVIVRGGERLRDGQSVTWDKSSSPATSQISRAL